MIVFVEFDQRSSRYGVDTASVYIIIDLPYDIGLEAKQNIPSLCM